MAKNPIILNKKVIAESSLFRIESLTLEFSNAQRRDYERLARGCPGGGAVLIVPMLDADTVLLIREYAAGVGRYELALPKGKIEAGEQILAAANRELKEEVGYGAKTLQHLKSISIAPSYLEHMTDIILATDLYEERLPGDEPEEIEVVPWKMDNLTELFSRGECTEARSIAALFLTREFLNHVDR